MTAAVRLPCSGCQEQVALHLDLGVALAKHPGNGKRGSLRVAPHNVSAEIGVHGGLLEWDCPLCGYADSTYEDADVRAVLT